MGSSVCCNLTQLDAFVLDSATPRYLCSGKRLGSGFRVQGSGFRV